MVGGDNTVRLALEVLPVPPSLEVTVTLLFCTPAAMAVKFTDNVHAALAARVPPDRLTDVPRGTAVALPPHVLVSPLGVTTTSPAGKVSVKATPVSGMVFATGLTMENVREVVPFSGILARPNTLAMVGGRATATLAVAVLPVPPLVDETVPVVLVWDPEMVPVIFTVIVQDAETAMFPPVRLTLPLPATAVAVPPQLLTSPLGVATSSPAGNVSVNATPACAAVLAAGLVRVNVRLVVPFNAISGAPNTLAIDGGATTIRVADAATPGPPSLDAIALVVLTWVPAMVPITFTVILQSELAARVPAERLTLPLPATAATVPPQLLDIPLGDATTIPDGNVSVKASPVNPVAAFWLKTKKVNCVEPFNGTLVEDVFGTPRGFWNFAGPDFSPNDLLNWGGSTTVRFAEEVLPVPPSVEVTVTLLAFGP